MKIINNIDRFEFQKRVRKKQVIFWGIGKMFFEALEKLSQNDKLNVAALIDNDNSKIGKKIVVFNNELTIQSFMALEDMEMSNCVIVISSKYYKEIMAQCEEIYCLKNIECYTWLDIYWNENLFERAMDRLRQLCKLREMPKGDMEILIDSYQEKAKQKKDYTIIPKLNIIVTEKCSLRCKDCRALIPLIDNPQNVPFEEVKEEILAVLSAVDDVIDMEPIGGEPFIYPYLAQVIELMVSSEKVNTVVISTNGTIIPDEKLTRCLQHPKVFVGISDYGHIEKMAKLVDYFEKNNISFEIETNQTWFDVGGIECRKRNEEELKEEYRNCYCQYLVKYIWNKKIWVCPRAPRLSALNVISDSHDYEELCAVKDIDVIRNNILHSYKTDYACACNYCSQGDLDIKYVRAGLQIDNRISNSDYTIVKRSEYEKLKSGE